MSGLRRRHHEQVSDASRRTRRRGGSPPGRPGPRGDAVEQGEENAAMTSPRDSVPMACACRDEASLARRTIPRSVARMSGFSSATSRASSWSSLRIQGCSSMSTRVPVEHPVKAVQRLAAAVGGARMPSIHAVAARSRPPRAALPCCRSDSRSPSSRWPRARPPDRRPPPCSPCAQTVPLRPAESSPDRVGQATVSRSVSCTYYSVHFALLVNRSEIIPGSRSRFLIGPPGAGLCVRVGSWCRPGRGSPPPRRRWWRSPPGARWP